MTKPLNDILSMRRFAHSFTKTKQDAEDVLTMSIIKILKADPPKKNPSGWMKQIIKHTARNYVRDRKTRERNDEVYDSMYHKEIATPFEICSAKQDYGWLYNAIDKLPKKQRETVWLRGIKEWSYHDIAEHMGCTYDTAKANYLWGIRNLKEGEK